MTFEGAGEAGGDGPGPRLVAASPYGVEVHLLGILGAPPLRVLARFFLMARFFLEVRARTRLHACARFLKLVAFVDLASLDLLQMGYRGGSLWGVGPYPLEGGARLCTVASSLDLLQMGTEGGSRL